MLGRSVRLDLGFFEGPRGQRFDGAGLPLGGEFQVNTYTTGQQLPPAVAMDTAGNFLVVWADQRGIFGQGNKPDRLVRGGKFLVGDRSGAEADRRVVLVANETGSEIPPDVQDDGDPTLHGATLRVIANGTTDSDQTFVLDASGWRRLATGFRYAGPTGADGDPVKRLFFRRALSGTVVLKGLLKGSVGTQSLDVVPPNAGDSGGVILEIGNGGATICAAFGGPAGGTEARDDAELWRIINATAQPGCPSP